MRQLKYVWAVVLATMTLFAQATEAPLSQQNVESFIASMQNFQPVLTQLEALDMDEAPLAELFNNSDIDPAGIDFNEVFSTFAQGFEQQRGTEAYTALDQHVTQHGFANIQDWSSVSARVYQAFFALTLGDIDPSLMQQVNSMRGELKDNPYFSEAQMEQMLALTGALHNTAKQAPAADVETVRPYMGAITQALEALN